MQLSKTLNKFRDGNINPLIQRVVENYVELQVMTTNIIEDPENKSIDRYETDLPL